MKLEVGKHYRTRDGRKAIVFSHDKSDDTFDVSHDNAGCLWHSSDGAVIIGVSKYDLIAEWTDETAQLTAIEHLRKASELFLAAGNDKAAFDVLGVVLDHE